MNDRTDAWGGDAAGRNRLTLAVVDAVRECDPRLHAAAAEDFRHATGPRAESASRTRCSLAAQAAEHGVDLIDVSSGGAVAHQQIQPGPGYQTGFAARIRRETGVATGTVGLLTSPGQAEHVVATGQADGVFIARAALRDPHWWLRAAFELGHDLQVGTPVRAGSAAARRSERPLLGAALSPEADPLPAALYSFRGIPLQAGRGIG